ncbi:MAG: aminoacyl-tRNA hydrolase [Endomicrobiales bacterium]|jgi:PTH1 family peptidyl-tRNA hydrolase
MVGVLEAHMCVTADIKLIVGLGNPDARYNNTRHNIGFDVVERLARQENVSWSDMKLGIKAHGTCLAGGQRLLKPLEYMNNSGVAVRAVADYFRITPAQTLVIVDDFSLSLGVLRLRSCGSAGGHNGLKSIIEYFSTMEFPRLRCGIGPVPPGWDPADFVLAKFSGEESKAAEDMIQRAAMVVQDVIRDGFNKTASKGLN